MKILKYSLIVVSIIGASLLPSTSFAADEYVMTVCDECSYSQMRTKAINKNKSNSIVNVQVVNPSSGTVQAFDVYHETEPGVSYINVEVRTPNQDVAVAAREAKVIINQMKANASANADIINQVKNTYPGNLPNHLQLHIIPSNLGTANDMTLGSPEHLALSQYLTSKANVPISQTILSAIFASMSHGVIAVFEADNSILVLLSKVSTIRYEPIGGIYIDGEGNVKILGGGGNGSGGSGSGGSEWGYESPSLYCTSWWTYSGTNADGTYCESWGFY
jgi:hypothetical protein